MDNCWPLLNQKQHGMFPLRRFVDLVRIYLLLIVSRNHSNRVKYCSDLAACCPLHNLYFNGLQIKSWQNFKDKGHLFTSNLPWLLLKFAEYLFLKHFFISLNKCFAPWQLFNIEISWNFHAVVQKNILFFIPFFTKLFPIAVVLPLYKDLIFLKEFDLHT